MNMKPLVALTLLCSSLSFGADGLLDAAPTVYKPEDIAAQMNAPARETSKAITQASTKASTSVAPNHGTNLGTLKPGTVRVIPRQEGDLVPAQLVSANQASSATTVSDRLGKLAAGNVPVTTDTVTTEVRQQRDTISNVLPGLEAGKSIKPLIIKIQPGVTEVVKVAKGYPSLIMTPFVEPQVVDGGKVKLVYAGSNVYVMPLGDEPEALFISDKGKSTVVVSLMVVPSELPAQQITLQLDGFKGVESQSLAEQRERKDDYVSSLVDILREVGQSSAPSGYTESAVVDIEARIGTLKAIPQKKFSGTDRNIFTYKLVNDGTTPVSISEPSFYAKGVRAVALFPKIHLMPREETTLYIMSDKTNQEASK